MIDIGKHIEAMKDLRSFLPELKAAVFIGKLDFYAKLDAVENGCLKRLFGEKKRIRLVLCKCWGDFEGSSQSDWTYYDFCLDPVKNVYTSEFTFNFKTEKDYAKWAKRHFKEAAKTLEYQRHSSSSNWKDIFRHMMMSTIVFPSDSSTETALLVKEVNRELLGEEY